MNEKQLKQLSEHHWKKSEELRESDPLLSDWHHRCSWAAENILRTIEDARKAAQQKEWWTERLHKSLANPPVETRK